MLQNCRSHQDFQAPLPKTQRSNNLWVQSKLPGVAPMMRQAVPPRGVSRDEAGTQQRASRHQGQQVGAGPGKVFENDAEGSAVLRTQLRRNESQPAVQNTANCANLVDQQIQIQIQLINKNNENLNKVDFCESVEDAEGSETLELAHLGLPDAQTTTEQSQERPALFQPQIITQQRSNLHQQNDLEKRKSKLLTRARSGFDIDIDSIMQENQSKMGQATVQPTEAGSAHNHFAAGIDAQFEHEQQNDYDQLNEVDDEDQQQDLCQSSREEQAVMRVDTQTNSFMALSQTQPQVADNMTCSLLMSKLTESKLSCHPVAQPQQPATLSCQALLNFEELVDSRCQTSRREMQNNPGPRYTTVEGKCECCKTELQLVAPQLRLHAAAIPSTVAHFPSQDHRKERFLPTQFLSTANCSHCGNFLMVKLVHSALQSTTEIMCQALKEHPKQQYRPDFNLLKIMRSLKKYQGPLDRSRLDSKNQITCAHMIYDSNAKYLKYRRKTVRALFQTSERFGFNSGTVHHAITLFDGTLIRKAGTDDTTDAIEHFRNSFASCKGVISEQICTFIAAVSLFVSAKYHEIKYPVVEDVCMLMQCPFTFEEFVEMEAHILQDRFQWDLQIPTVIEALQALLSQGVIFTTDMVSFTQKSDEKASKDETNLLKVNENKKGESPKKTTVQAFEIDEAQREALFSRMWKLCMSLLPNLLVYDGPLTLQAAESSSPVHMALAIIIEARRSLGIESNLINEKEWNQMETQTYIHQQISRVFSINQCRVSDVALLFMCFGDMLIPEHKVVPNNGEQSPFNALTQQSPEKQSMIISEMVKEMSKVHELVSKVQLSLYNKTFKLNTDFIVQLKNDGKVASEDNLKRKTQQDSEQRTKRVNPTPLPHSEGSGAFSSTYPTTDQVKNKTNQSTERDHKPTLQLRQLKIDDVHIESLNIPSRESQYAAAPESGATRPPIMFPQVEIQGSSASSNGQSKKNSSHRRMVEPEDNHQRSSNAHHYKYQSINSLQDIHSRSVNSARVTSESLAVSQNVRSDHPNVETNRNSHGQNEMTIYESLKVECLPPPVQVGKQKSQNITDLNLPQIPQRSTYQTIRSQSSSQMQKSLESSSQNIKATGNSNKSNNRKAKPSKSKSKSSNTINDCSKSAWSNNAEVECNEAARAKPVRISAQLEVKVTKAPGSTAQFTGMREVNAASKSGKNKGPSTHRMRKGSCVKPKVDSNNKPLLILKKQATHNGLTSRNTQQQLIQNSSVMSLHQDSAPRHGQRQFENDLENYPQNGPAHKVQMVGKPKLQQQSSQVNLKLKSVRRKFSEAGKQGTKGTSGISESSIQNMSGIPGSGSCLQTHRPNPSGQYQFSKNTQSIVMDPASQTQLLTKLKNSRSVCRKGSQKKSHCSQTTLADHMSSARNSSSSAIRHKVNQQNASIKRLTAGKFQRQKEASESIERYSSSRQMGGQGAGDTTERINVPAGQNCVSHEIIRDLKAGGRAGVNHAQASQGNGGGSFVKGARCNSQRGSIGAISTMNRKTPRSGGGGIVTSFAQKGQPFGERPATSRANGRTNGVGMGGNGGYVTARANHQQMQAEGMFGPKIPQGANFDQSLFTIQYSKDHNGAEVLFTECNAKPQQIQQQAGQQAYFTENIESTNQTPLSTHQSACSIFPKDGKPKLKQNAGPVFASRQSSRRGECPTSNSHSRMSSKLGSHTTNSIQPQSVVVASSHGQGTSSKSRQNLKTSCGISTGSARRQTNHIQQKLPLRHMPSGGDLQRFHDSQSNASALQKPPKAGAKYLAPQRHGQAAPLLNRSSTKPSLVPTTTTHRGAGSMSRKSPIIQKLPSSRQGLTKVGSSKGFHTQTSSDHRNLQQAQAHFQQATSRVTPRGGDSTHGPTLTRATLNQTNSKSRPQKDSSLHTTCRSHLPAHHQQQQQHTRLRSSLHQNNNTASTATVENCGGEAWRGAQLNYNTVHHGSQQKSHQMASQVKITPNQLLNR